MKHSKVIAILIAIITIFSSIWGGAYLYNTLSEGYQFAAACTGTIGVALGYFFGMYTVIVNYDSE